MLFIVNASRADIKLWFNQQIH